MTDWQPIETAPKDGNCLLLWFAAEGCKPWSDVCYWEDEWGSDNAGSWVLSCECEHSCARPQGYYTHWMPMPEPPKG